jgi:hypothetical protein
MRASFVAIAGLVTAPLILNAALAGDDRTRDADRSVPAKQEAKAPAAASATKPDESPPEISLLDAVRKGQVAVQAEGIGDGRMTVSVTNRTRKPLRVVLPPGIVAQGATGQFGGMGGMGGGGMGGMGGMGGGMGGMGGMGGGMGGMGGMGGGMGGMGGGMRGGGGTMPPMMGMMMLARMIMYFCGDFDSWDMRSMMMGMGGGMGMMGGGMGGMGGMGGGMGGMGGMMRSVPPTGLPFAELRPGQTRKLPTRLVSMNPPDAEAGVKLPEKGEPLTIGDIGELNQNPRVQKALRRLAAEKAATTVSQLVMWNVAADLDWPTIAELSQRWANRFELALARDCVDRLDADSPALGETGKLFFQIDGTDPASTDLAAGLKKALEGKIVLGLHAELGIPARPAGPALACRVRIKAQEALVQLTGSDPTARGWVPFSKFTLTAPAAAGEAESLKLADAVAEGLLGRLVRAQVVKGAREKGKLTYRIRIENVSPLRLNGLAAAGMNSKNDEAARVLQGISIPPRRSMTVPASEEVVKGLGLKQGIRITAIDLSGL